MGADKSSELRPGTLDLHVLKALCPRRMHGYRTAQHLKTISEDVLQVGESSLYPVLQRALLNQSKVEWGTSEKNRSARHYTFSAIGRKQLSAECKEFDRMVLVIQKVLA